MGPVISLFVIVALSLIIVRIGAVALKMTGLSRDVADFQAYSAFFGVGFTTAEAELAVSTPVRRRIIKHLILTGNVGATAGLGSVIVAFVTADGLQGQLRTLLWISMSLVALLLVAISPPTRRLVDWAIKRTLRHSGVLHPADYGLLLRLHSGFEISEAKLDAESPLIGRTLAESRLGSHGVVVLGISRRDTAGLTEFIGAPHGGAELQAGDVLTVYGTEARVHELLHTRGSGARARATGSDQSRTE